MDLLSLNYDVLSLIVSFLSQRDARTLSLTNWRVHTLAHRHSLSAVTLRRPAQLVPFLRYMLADAPARAPLLRELDLEVWSFMVFRSQPGAQNPDGDDVRLELDFTCAPLLGKLFAHATNLRRLLIGHLHGLLAAYPALGSAIAALPCLVDLELERASAAALPLVQRLRSVPRRLVLAQFVGERVHHRTVLAALAPLQGLAQLELSKVSEHGPPPRGGDARPQFPGVRALSIVESRAPMSAFVHAFPYLRTLVMRHLSYGPRPLDDARDPACWQALDCVDTEPRDFLHWRIVCPVRWLKLYASFLPSPEDADTAVEAVRCTTPVVLFLELKVDTRDIVWRNLVHAMGSVRFLELQLSDKNLSHMTDWVETIPDMMADLRLLAVRVCIRIPVSPSDTVVSSQARALAPEFPARFAAAVPHLKAVALEVLEALEPDTQEPVVLVNSVVPEIPWGSLPRLASASGGPAIKGQAPKIAMMRRGPRSPVPARRN